MNPGVYRPIAGGRLGVRTWRPGGRRTLWCLPYAGGQSLGFEALADALPADWTVHAVDPPGHGWAKGPRPETVEDTLDLLLGAPDVDLDGALIYGHSLGGYIAMGLGARGERQLRGLVIAATVPPHGRDKVLRFSGQDDPSLLRSLEALGGIPEGLAERGEALLVHFLPLLRADFHAYDHFAPPKRPLDLPLLVLGGLEDWFCTPALILEWARYARTVRVDLVPGGHLFVGTHAAATAARVLVWERAL